MSKAKFFLIIFGVLHINFSSAQLTASNDDRIRLAVPFLVLSTDGRTSAMGDAGIALKPIGSSIGSFSAKLSQVENSAALNLSYTPWLNNLVADRRLMNVDGYKKLNERTTLLASLTYLSYGTYDLIDANRISAGTIRPAEYAFSMGLVRSFGKSFSLGTNFKYINSNLYAAQVNFADIQSGNAFAVDISSHFNHDGYTLGIPSSLGLTVNISNIGPKMAYYYSSEKHFFLPTILKIGSALSLETDDNQNLSFALDLSKPMVPGNGNSTTQQPSVLGGMVSSFSDSSTGLGGELKEIGFSVGMEYLFKKSIAFRTGYNLQSADWGMGSFFSVGSGLKYKAINIDLSYIAENNRMTFLGNTLRISFGYTFGE